MKRVLFVLAVVFGIACLLAFGYALYTYTEGQVNAGFALIPLFLSAACSRGYNALEAYDGKR